MAFRVSGPARISALVFIPVVWAALMLPVAPTGGPANVPPTVSITDGPVQGGDAPYRLTVTWTGSDPDSADSLAHFEYAVDPPSAFTPGEIAHPETAPGVTVTVVPGPAPNRDTLRVSKLLNGDTIQFDWIQTPDSSQAFRFSTPDSLFVIQGGVLVLERWGGNHALHLRGVDTFGAVSDPVVRSFRAINLPPTAAITYPVLGTQELLQSGAFLKVRGYGLDPDAPGPPVAYHSKILRLDTLDPPIPIIPAPNPLVMDRLGEGWVRHEAQGDSLFFSDSLDVPGNYLVAVRAEDENGATDITLEYGRNIMAVTAYSTGGRPLLVLSSVILGHHSFQMDGFRDAGGIFAGSVDVAVLCSAEAYGGICASMRWGLDVDPSGEAGWSPWGTLEDLVGLPLTIPGAHSLSVSIRDGEGVTTTGTVTFTVLEPLFDREALFLDDSFDGNYPSDAQHDAFWNDLFTNSGRFGPPGPTGFDRFDFHGVIDREFLEPQPAPTLFELGRYRLLVWENLGSGYNGISGLLRTATLDRRLSNYLSGGGSLWLGGRLTVSATVSSPNGVNANLVYPKEEVSPGEFAWDFLKLRSTLINNDKGSRQQHTLVRARPFPGQPEIYPFMEYVPGKLNLAQVGIPHCDAVFDPIFAESEPGFRGELDSLYTYGAAGPEIQGTSSIYQGRLMAVRWHDPDPAPLHGRVQWFGFPLYYFNTSQAQDVFNRSIDWFREDDPTIPVRLAYLTAERRGQAAWIRWAEAESDPLSSFWVHRQIPGGDRERVGAAALAGKERYEFVDDRAPAAAVDYWIEAWDRSGAREWYGPARLASMEEPFLRFAAPQPNPFTKETHLAFETSGMGAVELVVHDLGGRRVAVLVEGSMETGERTITWDGRDDGGRRLPAGLYFVHLRAGAKGKVHKVLLLN